MKFDPITSPDPSNHDLLKMLVQVHECVEDGKRVTKRAVARVAVKAEAARVAAAATSGKVTAIQGNVEAIQGDVTAIQTALGLTEDTKHVSGLSSPFKAFIRSAGATATAIGGLLLLYRAAVALWPGTWAFMQAANHAILSGKF